jgi:hypothetical protein
MLDLINGEYAAIVSLGSGCQVAHQLRVNKRRKEAFPFDWVVSDDIKKVAELIENRFSDYLDSSKLSIRQNVDNPERIRVRNLEYNIYFMHDFHNLATFDSDLVAVQEKYQKRIRRFYHLLNREQNRTEQNRTEQNRTEQNSGCLFIRMLSKEDSLDDGLALGNAVRAFDESHRIILITPKSQDELSVEPLSDGIFLLKMNLKPDGDASWKGNHAEWQKLLAGIRFCRPN